MNQLNAIFSLGRSAVLDCLFAGESTEIYLREIARRSGLNLRTVQRELEKLLSLELIRSRRDGNRQYFSANPSHPIYPELRGIVRKCGAIASVVASALSKLEGIEVAFIFGSVAYGTAGAESDIDLMVIGDIGLRKLAPPLRVAAEKLGREVNPYNTTAENWHDKLCEGDAFFQDVMIGAKIFIKGSEDELERLAKERLA